MARGSRNRGPDGSYWAPVAHRAAHERRRLPKDFKLVTNPDLCRRIEAWMNDGWPPGLISAMLRRQHRHMIMDRMSEETGYRALYVQTRGSLRKDLGGQLLTKRRARKPHGAVDGRGKSLYREAFTIS